MLFETMLSVALLGDPATVAGNDDARQAVRDLYTYSTQSVRVDPAEVRRMVGEIESSLGEADGEAARAFTQLAEAARSDQPDGREVRVLARDLYWVLAGGEA
ncbi:MAG TPA: hypothetical protein VMN37_02695 [Gemmatimonadales bacterium]|nr:hypothetical protein [Gemmatimonadales bacterium]